MEHTKKIADMTLGEFLSAIDEHIEKKHDDIVYGIDGIAKLFGCSKSTAQRIKSSGVIDDAIVQVGRTIAVNVAKATYLYNLTNK